MNVLLTQSSTMVPIARDNIYWGYEGLRGVKRGYEGLRRVKRGCGTGNLNSIYPLGLFESNCWRAFGALGLFRYFVPAKSLD